MTPEQEKIELPIQKSKLKRKQLSALENVIELPCLECKEAYIHDINSYEGQGVFNFFCCGECEDKYAWRQ